MVMIITIWLWLRNDCVHRQQKHWLSVRNRTEQRSPMLKCDVLLTHSSTSTSPLCALCGSIVTSHHFLPFFLPLDSSHDCYRASSRQRKRMTFLGSRWNDWWSHFSWGWGDVFFRVTMTQFQLRQFQFTSSLFLKLTVLWIKKAALVIFLHLQPSPASLLTLSFAVSFHVKSRLSKIELQSPGERGWSDGMSSLSHISDSLRPVCPGLSPPCRSLSLGQLAARCFTTSAMLTPAQKNPMKV